jgi:hypothetical protein
MDMHGSQLINAPREKVYIALNDPEILQQSIPGCDTMEKVSDTEMKATVTVRVGPVKASFSGKMTLSDLDPPNGYTITGEGSGGMAGFAKAGVKVWLEPQGEGTLLNYTVNADIGGKIAQLGSRLIDGFSKKFAEDFFERFSEIIAPTAHAEEIAPPEVIVADTASDDAAAKKGWFSKIIG